MDNVDTHTEITKATNLVIFLFRIEYSNGPLHTTSHDFAWNGDNTMMTRSFKYFIWGSYFKLGKGTENIGYPRQHFLEKRLSTTIRLGYVHTGRLHFQIIK